MSIYVPSLTEIDNRGQEKVSSFDRALACAYIRAENERKKGKGLLFKQPEEELSFLIQVLWPFILVEKSPKKRVVFDAFGFMKRRFSDGDASKSNEFAVQLEKCIPPLMNRSDFQKNLEVFASYFKDFDKKFSHEISGCFSEINKVQDIVNSLRFSGSQEIKDAFTLPIAVDFKKANESVAFLSNLKTKAENDIKNLNELLLPLDSILKKWHDQIDEEIEQKRLPFDKKIKQITPEVNEKIRIIKQEKKEELAPLEPEISRIECELRQSQEAKARAEAEESMADDYAMDAAGDIDQANEDIQESEQELEIEQRETFEDENRSLRISRLETKISNARSRLYRAEERYSRAKDRQYECERATREASERVDEIEETLREKQGKYDEIEDSWNDLIAEQQQRIMVLEEERDSIIESLNQEAQSLTTKTEKIRGNVDNLVGKKRHLISEVESNDIPFAIGSLGQGTAAYAYVPFFVAMLSESPASRFVVFSPARLRREKSAAEKLGGFFLGKVPAITERRDQTLSSFAHTLNDLMQTNSSIRNEICEKVQKLNLLGLQHTREALLRGIDGLWSEGILNDKMVQKIKNSLPAKFTKVVNGTSGKLPYGAWCVCSKCGTYISLYAEYCPICGARLPKRARN